jgi:fumarate reductase flavoprotein subunit
MTETVVDVLVVGGGGGGLSAAVSARLAGASVILTEKEPELGGNTARSIGSIPGAGSRLQRAAGVEDGPDRFVADVEEHTGGEFNRAGLTRLAGISAELVQWLIDEVGIDLRLTEDYRHVGHQVNRLHNPVGREGRTLVGALAEFARRKGVDIRTSSAVTALERTTDGYRARTAGGAIEARSVVLATDGFGANDEMKRAEASRYADLVYLGGPGNTGDGIRLGRSLGGTTASMDAVLGFAIMGQPDDSPVAWSTMVSWTVVENGGIVVDGDGRRFGAEDVGYSGFVDDIIDHATVPVYAIFDRANLDSVAGFEDRFRLLVERADSPIRRVDPDSPPFGIDPEQLAATVDEYLAAARGESPDPFGRTDFGAFPLEGELYAARSVPSVLTTVGGLVVGDDAEVLDEAGAPIAGLYAAGGTARTIVGLRGAGGYLSGAGLLAALGYGYLAGRSAASRATT